MLKRFVAVVSTLALVGVALVFAPTASAAAPTDVAVTKVTGGYLMAYAEWTATGATGYEIRVFDAATGGTQIGGSLTSDTWRTSSVWFMRTGTPSTTYYLELTATNGDDSTVATRVAFTTTASTSVASDANAAVPTLSEAQGIKRGGQVYAKVGDGTYREGVLMLFNAATGEALPTSTPISNYLLSGELSALNPTTMFASDPTYFPAGETVYAALVVVGDNGFSPWSERVSFTPNDAASWGSAGVIATSGINSASLAWAEPYTRDGVTPPSVTGYRIDYTTDDGASWSTAIADTGSQDLSATIPDLTAGQSYRFRVAGIGAGAVLGGWSAASQAVVPTKQIPTVAWAPTNTRVQGSSGTLTPNAVATTSSDGQITYSVVPVGTTGSGCTVNETTGVITYSNQGTCQVKATAAETATYAEGSATVTFVFFIPAPPAGGGTSSGGSDSAPAPAPVVAPDPAPVPAPAPAPAPVVPVEIPNPAAVTAQELAAITPAQMTLITPQVFQQLPAATIAALTPEQASALTPAQVNTIRPVKAAQLPPAAVAAMSPTQVTALRPAAVARLQPAAIAQMSGEQLQALRPASVSRLTAPQLRSISPEQIDALTREQLRSMKPAQFPRLRPAAVAAMEPAQVRALKPSAVSRLRPAQVEALTPDQLDAMRPAQLRALTAEQTAGLSAAQQRALRG